MFSNIDNISIALSIIAVCFSFFTTFPLIFKNIKEYKSLNVKLKELDLAQEKFELMIKSGAVEANIYYIEEYLKMLYEKLCTIYPKTIFDISIRLLEAKMIETSREYKVIKLVSFPKKERLDVTNTIENNTKFSSIVEKGSKYFFVSDLKEYSRISNYKDEDKEFLNNYMATIVYPIRKKKDDKCYDLIGFLCVDSLQELKNVKKNERVNDYLSAFASVLYDFLYRYQKDIKLFSIKEKLP